MKNGAISWAVWLFLTAFYSLQYVFRVLPGFIMDDVISNFGITVAQFGSFGGLYYTSYTLGHIPVGILFDKFPAKNVMIFLILLLPLGTLPLLYSDSWTMVLIGRLLIGLGSAASPIGAMKLIRVFFGEEKFSFMLGMMVSIGLVVGPLFGGSALGRCMRAYSLDTVLMALIISTIILAAIAFVLIPCPRRMKSILGNSESQTESSSLWNDMKVVFVNRNLIIISLIGGFMVGPLEGFADLWGTLFFSNVYGLSRESSEVAGGILLAGSALGFSLLGYIVSVTRGYYSVIRISALVMLGSFLLFFAKMGNIHLFEALSIQFNFLHVILFFVGIASGYQITLIDKASSFVPLRVVAFANAAVNMIMMYFGNFFHSIMAGIAQSYVVDGQYTADALIMVASPIAIAMCIALVMLMFYKDKEEN